MEFIRKQLVYLLFFFYNFKQDGALCSASLVHLKSLNEVKELGNIYRLLDSCCFNNKT